MHKGLVVAAMLVGGLGRGVGQSGLSNQVADGYVTGVGSGGSFLVQGVGVRVSEKTQFFTRAGKEKTRVDSLDGLYVGERVVVWGKHDEKGRRFDATYVHVFPAVEAKVHGSAVIMQAEEGVDGGRVVWADGSRLVLTAATKMEFEPPLKGLGDVGTNVWMGYRGVRKVDGTVLVEEAYVVANHVDASEARLHEKKEFDAAAVGVDDKQGGVSRVVMGVDARRLPAHVDKELQARVDRVGQGLVPAYQKELAESDATKIPFRFRVVEAGKIRDVMALANGIILVPFPAVARLTTDGELAAMLADGIATVLEKQEWMDAGARRRWNAFEVASAAGTLFSLGALYPLGVASGAKDKLGEQERKQSGRDALYLMHAAGYDVGEAPLAWWLLATEKAEPLGTAEVPGRASDLYEVLGTTWRGSVGAGRAAPAK